MNERIVVMKLNQQQLELLDRTVGRGVARTAPPCALALREHRAARRAAAAKASPANERRRDDRV